MRVRASHGGLKALGFCAAAAVAAGIGTESMGCSGDSPGGAVRERGELALTLTGGVDLSSVTVTVSNSTTSYTQSTVVSLVQSQAIRAVLGGIPAGPGYILNVTGTTSTDLPCAGSSAPFSVATGAVTSVSVNVICEASGVDGGTGSVLVSGTTSIGPGCAAVANLSANPAEANVGATMQLSGSGLDSNGDTDVTLTWTLADASIGSLSTTSGGSAVFTCNAAGTETVTLTASTGDGGTSGGGATCSGSLSVSLVCDVACPTGADCTSPILNSSTPLPVPGLQGATSVAAGATFACVTLANGTVECWGHNAIGQLGNGTTTDTSVPTPVSSLTGAVAIATGETNTCALVSGGTMSCWGDNSFGQLGNGTTVGSSVPAPVPGLSGVTGIAVAFTNVCALLTGGSVSCWGDNVLGQLGSGSTGGAQTCFGGFPNIGETGDRPCSPTPSPVAGLTGVRTIANGLYVNYAILSDGTVVSWGDNTYGELGIGTTSGPDFCQNGPCSVTPVPIPGLTSVTSIAGGDFMACAATSAGTLLCWGNNDSGQLGNGTVGGGLVPTPTLVPNLTNVIGVAAGNAFVCALLSGGTVDCWGRNTDGEVGDGSNVTRPSPTPVVGLSGVRAISAGQNDACALLPDGTVACWGDNGFGQLGYPAASGDDGTTAAPDASTTEDSGEDSAAAAGADATLEAEGGGASDASLGDAGEGDSESATCATPIGIPLFGTVALTGTVSIPDTSATPVIGCFPLGTPTPTSGTLTFQLTSGLSSFIYVDQSGLSYVSNITGGGITGDTYECTFGGPLVAGPAIHPGCSENSGVDNGLTADITLTLNLSTGAISLSRLCGYGDSTCGTGTYIPNGTLNGGSTTSFSLTGSLSCADAGFTEPTACAAGGTCVWPNQVCCTFPPNPQEAGSPVGVFASGCLSNPPPTGQECMGGQITGCSSASSCPAEFSCCQPEPGSPITTGPSFCWAGGCPAGNPSL